MVYTNFLRQASEAFLTKQFCISAFKYKMVLQHLSNADSKAEILKKYVIQYMVCLSLMESISLSDLEAALDYLIDLEKNAGNVLPVVYYALAKTHMKFFRFDSALKTINKGFAVLNENAQCLAFQVPETDQVIRESRKEDLLAALIALKDECSKWHRPDAVCSMVECQKRTRHYPPSRDIFLSDPTIGGMVTVTCTNAIPCTIKYHKDCWTYMKLQMSTLRELSDKDLLDRECFTSGCAYNGAKSKITKIEVFDKSTNRLVLYEAPTSNADGVYLSSVKGAIKKKAQDLTQAKKLRRPHHFVRSSSQESSSTEQSVDEGKSNSEIDWRLKNLMKLREENFGLEPEENWQPDKEMFGNEIITSTSEFSAEPVIPEDEENPHIKIYLFDVLYEYIKNEGFITKAEVLAKWEELSSIINGDDSTVNHPSVIIGFLLSSRKVVLVDNYFCVPESLPQAYAALKSDTTQDFKDLLKESQEAKQSATGSFSTNTANGKENQVAEYDRTNDKQSAKSPFSNGNQITGSPECSTATFAKNGTVSLTPLNPFWDLLREKDNDESSKKPGETVRAKPNLPLGSPNTSKKIEETLIKSLLKERDALRRDLKMSLLTSKTISEKCTTLERESNEHKVVVETLLKSKREYQRDAELLLTEKTEALETYKQRHKLLVKDTETYKLELADKEKELEALKEKYLNMKRTMLERVLLQQYLASEFFISRNLQDCKLTLEVMNKFNHLFERKLGLSNVLTDHSKWLFAYSDFEKLYAENDNDYQRLKDLLKSDEYVKNNDDVVLTMRSPPPFPGRTLSEIVDYCFNMYTDVMMKSVLMPQYVRTFQKPPLQPVSPQFLATVPQNLPPLMGLPMSMPLPNLSNIQIECNNNTIKSMHSPAGVSPKPHDTSIAQNGPSSLVTKSTHSPQKINLRSNDTSIIQNGPSSLAINSMHSPQKINPRANDTKIVQNGPSSSDSSNFMTDQGNAQKSLDVETRNTGEKTDESNSLGKDTNDEVSRKQSPNTDNQALKQEYENSLGGESNAVKEQGGLLNSIEEAGASCGNTNVDKMQEPKNASQNDNKKRTGNNDVALAKRFDTIMFQLRLRYIGIMELDLLESLQNVKDQHNGSLSGLPMKVIIQEVERYILLRQGKYLCMYESETSRPARNDATPKIVTPKKQQVSQQKSNTKKPATFQVPTKVISKAKKTPAAQKNLMTLMPMQLTGTPAKKAQQTSMPTKKAPQPSTPTKKAPQPSTPTKKAPQPSTPTKKAPQTNTPTKKVPQTSTPAKCPWNLAPPVAGTWKKQGPESECIICMESTKNMSNPVYTLPCQHSFHKSCIKAWFQQNQSCPTCRVHCTIDDEFPPLPS